MDLALSADEEELRRGARRVLGERSSPKQVRAAMAREDGHDAELWRLCARELGWAGLGWARAGEGRRARMMWTRAWARVGVRMMGEDGCEYGASVR